MVWTDSVYANNESCVQTTSFTVINAPTSSLVFSWSPLLHRTVNANQRISTGVVVGTQLHMYSTGYGTWQDPYIQCVFYTDPNTLFMQQLVTTLASIQATPTSRLCHLL